MREQAAKKTGAGGDPRRVKLFYKGRNMKDDERPCRAEGLRSDAECEVLCVVGEAPTKEKEVDSGEESEETGVDAQDGAGQKPKRKRVRHKKKKKNGAKPNDAAAASQIDGIASAASSRSQTPSSSTAPTPQTPLQKLERIASAFHTTFVPQCVQYTSNPPSEPAKRDWEHKRLTETILAQILLKLDGVETEGDEVARMRRKELVREAQAVLGTLDAVPKL